MEEKAHTILMLLITIMIFYLPQIPRQPSVHDQVGGALTANEYSAARNHKAPRAPPSLAIAQSQQVVSLARQGACSPFNVESHVFIIGCDDFAFFDRIFLS